MVHRMHTEKNQKTFPYKELTEKLIGYSFDIFKQIGGKHPEKFYQNAFENKLKDNGINYKRENYCKLEVDNKRIGYVNLDFLIENKVVIEFKVREIIYSKDIAQILSYMRLKSIPIGLILLFTDQGVRVRRFII